MKMCKNITHKQMTIMTAGKLSSDKYNFKPDRKHNKKKSADCN